MKTASTHHNTRIIQFTAGNGPPECSWVVSQIVDIFMKEASFQKIEVKCLQKTVGQLPCTVETCTLEVSRASPSFVNSWLGTIQWIGKSPFRKFHKRKNWFIGVFEIPSLMENSFDEKDIRFQAIRSSGAGGQHVNKVSTAIRATHLPSGESVLAMDSRSQSQNKALAMQRLKDKVHFHYEQQLIQNIKSQWLNQKSIIRGASIRTYEGLKMFPVKV